MSEPSTPTSRTTDGGTRAARSVGVIVVAAGASARMGFDKLWADLDGAPVLAHSLRTLATLPGLTALVVVAPPARHEAIGRLEATAVCVAGGARRQDSVAAGLEALARSPEPPAFVLVHDGARPLVTRDLALRVLEAARAHDAAIPTVPVVDTIKRVDADGAVRGTLDRAELRAVQTPQAFARPLLERAHAHARDEATTDTPHATDDASMVEALGVPVRTVEGDPANLKVTTPEDLVLVRALLRVRAATQAGGR